MGYNDDKSVKENLEDYAKTQAWNQFTETGSVEDYNNYKEIERDINKNEKENEND